VESEEQLDELRRQGCGEIQGYFISRPKPAAEIAAMLGVTVAPQGGPVVTLSQGAKEEIRPWTDEMAPDLAARRQGE